MEIVAEFDEAVANAARLRAKGGQNRQNFAEVSNVFVGHNNSPRHQ